MPLPQQFGKYGPNAQMSFAPNVPNISTGNPMIDQFISLLLSGSGVAPRPMPGQSVMDSYLARNRSQEFLSAMRGGFSGQLVAQKLGGIDPNSGWGSLVSTFAGNPDGMINSPIMRAFNGGNPVRAQMALMANMTGMNNYMGTGRIGNASLRDVSNTMSGFTKTLFDHSRIEQKDLDEQRKFSVDAASSYIKGDKDRAKRFDAYMDHGTFNSQKFELDRAKGKLNKFAADEIAEVLKKFNPLEELAKKKGQLIPTKFNFDKSAGFELQDLTSAYTSAQDVGLFNYKMTAEASKRRAYADAGITPDQYKDPKWREANASAIRKAENDAAELTSSQFAQNAPFALRATADLTGATSANQAVEHMNRLFSISGTDQEGNSFIRGSTMNLGNEKDAQYAEKLQRDVKSVSRNAGISIEAMLGIVEQTKALAARYPGLSSMGGTGVIENTLKVFKMSQILASSAGSDQVRRDGGLVHSNEKQMALNMENRAEPISRGIVSLYGRISNSNFNDVEKEKMYEQLRDWEKNGRGTAQDNNDRIQRIAQAMGISAGKANIIMHSAEDATAGDELLEARQRLGKKADISGEAATGIKANIIASHQEAMYDEKIAENDPAFKGYKSGAEAMAAYETALQTQSSTGLSTAQINSKFAISEAVSRAFPNATAEERQRIITNRINRARLNGDNAKLEAASIDAAQNKNTEMETQMSHQSGMLYAPIASVLVQEFMGGKPGEEYQKFLGAITSKPLYARQLAIGQATTALGENIGGAAEQANLFYEEHGGVKDLDPAKVRQNLRDQGMDEKQIEDVMKQRAAYNEGGREAFLKAGKAGFNAGEMMRLHAHHNDAEAKDKLKKAGLSAKDIQLASDHAWGTGLGSQVMQDRWKTTAINEDTYGKMLLSSSGANAINRTFADQLVNGRYKYGSKYISDYLADLTAKGGNEKAIADKVHEALKFAEVENDKGEINGERLSELGSTAPRIEAQLGEQLKDFKNTDTGQYDIEAIINKAGGHDGNEAGLASALAGSKYALDKNKKIDILDSAGKIDKTKLRAHLAELNKDAKIDYSTDLINKTAPNLSGWMTGNNQTVAGLIGKKEEALKAMGMAGKDDLGDKLEQIMGPTNGKLEGMNTSLATIAEALSQLAKVQ